MQEFRVVRNDQNGGSAIKQWARAVAEAKGDLLWIAEADDFADPKFLATVGSCFGDPEVVLAYSQSQQVGANGKMMARDYLGYVSDVDSELWRADYRRDGETEIAEALSVKNTIPNVSAVLFRRTVLADVLKESLEELCDFRNVADWLCYVRVLQRGAVAFRAEALNYHRRHAAGVTISSADRRHLDEIAAMQQTVEQMTAIREEKRRAALEMAHVCRKAVWAYVTVFREVLGLPENKVVVACSPTVCDRMAYGDAFEFSWTPTLASRGSRQAHKQTRVHQYTLEQSAA